MGQYRAEHYAGVTTIEKVTIDVAVVSNLVEYTQASGRMGTFVAVYGRKI